MPHPLTGFLTKPPWRPPFLPRPFPPCLPFAIRRQKKEVLSRGGSLRCCLTPQPARSATPSCNHPSVGIQLFRSHFAWAATSRPHRPFTPSTDGTSSRPGWTDRARPEVSVLDVQSPRPLLLLLLLLVLPASARKVRLLATREVPPLPPPAAATLKRPLLSVSGVYASSRTWKPVLAYSAAGNNPRPNTRRMSSSAKHAWAHISTPRPSNIGLCKARKEFGRV